MLEQRCALLYHFADTGLIKLIFSGDWCRGGAFKTKWNFQCVKIALFQEIRTEVAFAWCGVWAQPGDGTQGLLGELLKWVRNVVLRCIIFIYFSFWSFQQACQESWNRRGLICIWNSKCISGMRRKKGAFCKKIVTSSIQNTKSSEN